MSQTLGLKHPLANMIYDINYHMIYHRHIIQHFQLNPLKPEVATSTRRHLDLLKKRNPGKMPPRSKMSFTVARPKSKTTKQNQKHVAGVEDIQLLHPSGCRCLWKPKTREHPVRPVAAIKNKRSFCWHDMFQAACVQPNTYITLFIKTTTLSPARKHMRQTIRNQVWTHQPTAEPEKNIFLGAMYSRSNEPCRLVEP